MTPLSTLLLDDIHGCSRRASAPLLLFGPSKSAALFASTAARENNSLLERSPSLSFDSCLLSYEFLAGSREAEDVPSRTIEFGITVLDSDGKLLGGSQMKERRKFGKPKPM